MKSLVPRSIGRLPWATYARQRATMHVLELDGDGDDDDDRYLGVSGLAVCAI